MLPVLYSQLSKLIDGKQAVRLLGVIVSGLFSQQERLRERLVITPSLWPGELSQEFDEK
jgi:hypothetical protein